MIEIAMAIFAGINAVAAAVQVWQSSRNKEEAAEVFDKTFEEVRASPYTLAAAEELILDLAEEAIKDLESRADKCWKGYRDVLGGDYLPDEVDHATKAVQACVCRELGRIYDLKGEIPRGGSISGAVLIAKSV